MNDGLSLHARSFPLASVGCNSPEDDGEPPACSTKFRNHVNYKFSRSRHNRMRRSALPNGFTLMELLIVIAIILILMLMAVPTIGVMKKHANETSAINSLRTIVTAEIMYSSSYPANGFACSLTALGGDPASGVPTLAAAQLIQADLASGYKSGYIFNITNCSKTTVAGTDHLNGYTVTAVPEAVGKTGDRGFCSDQNGGSPKYDPEGGTSCTLLLQ
jgi:type IV pilus assembly protein PilA